MICCNRTKEKVTVSELNEYVFYNPTLDEDLYRFETHVKCSDDARHEASLIIEKGSVPDNYSNDKPLQSFVNDYLKSGHYHLDAFKALDVLTKDTLEFDEAVLLSVLYSE